MIKQCHDGLPHDLKNIGETFFEEGYTCCKCLLTEAEINYKSAIRGRGVMGTYKNSMNFKIHLRDLNRKLVEEWETQFKGIKNIEISQGDIFDIKADAIVSPANSFGSMSGGIDLVYRNRFGRDLETVLQRKICAEYYGELLVGEAVLIKIPEDKNYQYMISAPTMRLPESVKHTMNAYYAFRAVLITAHKYNITSILCPGLCTLTGGMDPKTCAVQMKMAFEILKNYIGVNKC